MTLTNHLQIELRYDVPATARLPSDPALALVRGTPAAARIKLC